ncbi:MAG: LysR family transcriptional regulator [Gammaproteobacteria bacterium]|jgi:DNA-binding transcriptional LysR family regulator|nr:LysR family transcriptional regulator [Gammaproteobacteria bacterium]MBT3722319.1 LysR family transcriptional regulator [Gammaproteobacteria bacterium]MBT4077246.1 LysR family transcriptional regulator [Gammaproteobacteria bacterium]MBT4196647.1 LysR family transcriptional regulator [Gammaproteobacteria bacterium]MBT4448399.1 LysR family transcriptional regulator [Gammaproteobacteria bacterium]
MEYRNLPDLKGLAALRAVVELGGVEQAGKSLHIGQPAVTKRLRALDECYGMPLMQRKGRKLELTTAGDRVYAFSRLALDHQTSLLEDLQSLTQGQNKLRLEVTFAIGEQLLPSLLLSFADNHPEYRLQSRMGYSRRIETRLATGLSDLALIEKAPDHPDILVQKWFEDELILVCAPNHSLSSLSVIPIQELTRQKFVLRESQSSMRIILDQKLQDAGILKLPISLEVGSTDTIVEMLSRGLHMSFLPKFAVKDALKNNLLRHINVDPLKIKVTLWIARNRSSINNPVAEAFIQLLRNQSN